MLRRTLTCLLLFSLLLLPAGSRTLAGVAPPAPGQMPGGWWAGAVPPGADPASPVLVFVAGLHQPATSWWGPTRYYGDNDMYATAWRSGLRTAFVEMPDGAGEDMWVNGRALADRLVEITRHFGVERVTLVTHSKGGVDANAAAAFYGAAPRLAAVITLSAPHWGSPLADLAMSRWAAWLAALLGEHDAGVASVQTGYMEWFRSVADARTDDRSVPYYTVSGTGWGPLLGALRLGGLYLSPWGQSDGMVPEESAHRPGARHLATLPLDHDATRTAQVWPALAGVLSGAGAPAARPDYPAPTPAGGAILRGGIARNSATVSLPVEGGARRAEFYVLTSGPAVVVAIGPDGRRHRALPQASPPEVLAGAQVNAVALPAPAAGAWRIEIEGRMPTGYLVVGAIDSPAAAALRLPPGPLAPGGRFNLGLTLSPTLARGSLQASLLLGSSGATPGDFSTAAAPGAVSFDPGAGAGLVLPAGAGVYPLAVTVSGRLADGTAFERSFATSVAVVPPGEAPPGAG